MLNLPPVTALYVSASYRPGLLLASAKPFAALNEQAGVALVEWRAMRPETTS